MPSVLKFDTWQNTAGVAYNTVLQTKQFNYSSVYENTAQATEYDLPSPLGDGTANITLMYPTSKILITCNMHCGQEDTWRENYFRVYYSIAGGAWTLLSNAGFCSSNYVSGNNGGCQSVSTTYLATIATASNIRFKITQVGHANGGYLHLNQNTPSNTTAANNTVSVASSILLQEIAQ